MKSIKNSKFNDIIDIRCISRLDYKRINTGYNCMKLSLWSNTIFKCMSNYEKFNVIFQYMSDYEGDLYEYDYKIPFRDRTKYTYNLKDSIFNSKGKY